MNRPVGGVQPPSGKEGASKGPEEEPEYVKMAHDANSMIQSYLKKDENKWAFISKRKILTFPKRFKLLILSETGRLKKELTPWISAKITKIVKPVLEEFKTEEENIAELKKICEGLKGYKLTDEDKGDKKALVSIKSSLNDNKEKIKKIKSSIHLEDSELDKLFNETNGHVDKLLNEIEEAKNALLAKPSEEEVRKAAEEAKADEAKKSKLLGEIGRLIKTLESIETSENWPSSSKEGAKISISRDNISKYSEKLKELESSISSLPKAMREELQSEIEKVRGKINSQLLKLDKLYLQGINEKITHEISALSKEINETLYSEKEKIKALQSKLTEIEQRSGNLSDEIRKKGIEISTTNINKQIDTLFLSLKVKTLQGKMQDLQDECEIRSAMAKEKGEPGLAKKYAELASAFEEDISNLSKTISKDGFQSIQKKYETDFLKKDNISEDNPGYDQQFAKILTEKNKAKAIPVSEKLSIAEQARLAAAAIAKEEAKEKKEPEKSLFQTTVDSLLSKIKEIENSPHLTYSQKSTLKKEKITLERFQKSPENTESDSLIKIELRIRDIARIPNLEKELAGTFTGTIGLKCIALRDKVNDFVSQLKTLKPAEAEARLVELEKERDKLKEEIVTALNTLRKSTQEFANGALERKKGLYNTLITNIDTTVASFEQIARAISLL